MLPTSNLPPWLSKSQSPAYQTSLQRTLQQRENIRSTLRSLHLQKLQPPKEIPRHLFDFYSIAEACHPHNRKQNRYSDIAPYDRTIVSVGTDSQPRYLNASWCLERSGRKWWIASQAPLPASAHSFLSLIRQPISLPASASSTVPNSAPQSTRVRTVVQLTMLVEGGRTKAHSYFPAVVGQSDVHYPEPSCSEAALRATLLEQVELPDACCIKSKVSISLMGDDDHHVTFQHLLYTAWPDHGVPEPKDQVALMNFLRLVDSTNRVNSQDPDPPMIVGCSAGVGRTGTFIAVSSLFRAHGFLPPAISPSVLSLSSPLGPLPPAFDTDLVAQEVDSLREQRPSMVQRPAQLELVYSLLEAAFVQ
ncbi:protein-tyrosine phosphatase-like protein [Favolaschia claudopus]|uniref:Protein-tyrosine phosphatase-like protein n=1 Tax=Favolaschia claudopus TaxID=2862362 RepID=A0AAW0AB49_9AGAR